MNNFKDIKAEEITGTLAGSVSGVITSVSGMDIVLTLIIALFTGFLGALGAHLFKVIAKKFSKK